MTEISEDTYEMGAGTVTIAMSGTTLVLNSSNIHFSIDTETMNYSTPLGDVVERRVISKSFQISGSMESGEAAIASASESHPDIRERIEEIVNIFGNSGASFDIDINRPEIDRLAVLLSSSDQELYEYSRELLTAYTYEPLTPPRRFTEGGIIPNESLAHQDISQDTLDRADEAISRFSQNGGLLTPEQSDRFIELLVDGDTVAAGIDVEAAGESIQKVLKEMEKNAIEKKKPKRTERMIRIEKDDLT